ncbi:MAG: response regulator transcription factor [Melioribacteraceae bacterium]|nr:response regulator transcription factor [Melioribacteraceae bacterium]
MISLAIVEDIKEIREPIFEFFKTQDDILCQIAVGSVEEFWNQYDGNFPLDVILLDIGLPGISGLSAIQNLKEKIQGVDIIILTVFDDEERIFRAIQSGATGYLLKNTSLAEIKKGVMDVHSGGSAITPLIARKVFEHFDKPQKKLHTALTPKEQEIINYLVDGQSYKVIAANLGNSIETIKHHAKNIYKKLHVNSKSEVVAKVLQQNTQ